MFEQDQSAAQTPTIQQPSLPKGGGTIAGMGEALGAVGMDGAATMTIPLPISNGRGVAPQLALSYSSLAGNSPFGLGWSLAIPRISQSTKFGVPTYQDDDLMIGVDGEFLIERADEPGITSERLDVSSFRDQPLPGNYHVRRYRSRIERFAIYERYTNQETGVDDFWIVHDPDGTVHVFGLDAKTVDPAAPERIATWHLKETIAVNGDHVVYRYRAEDGAGVDLSGSEQNRSQTAARYLVRADYGCDTGTHGSFCLTNSEPDIWFFSLVLDYGERGTNALVPPTYEIGIDAVPLVRQDPFSTYTYGFEVRFQRLCRQALMFHRNPSDPEEQPHLTSRLLIDYQESPLASQLHRARTMAYNDAGDLYDTPPLELAYSNHHLQTDRGWTESASLNLLNDVEHSALVDLFGEGLPGVLHKSSGAWAYCAPIRDNSVGGDAIAYADPIYLPAAPFAADGAAQSLLDITGNGRLDWVSVSPASSGYFELDANNNWGAFTPFMAMPLEALHPSAHFSDMIGAGLIDLALVGPNSVRVYPNARWEAKSGFSSAVETILDVGDLPTFDSNQFNHFVAFADVLGSGAQHLVCITPKAVRCWPNLGHGQFGQVIELATLDYQAETFDPARVYLADVNGSGAVDIIYARRDGFDIHLNRSGNGFDSPVTLGLPDGVMMDDTCRVHIADIDGNGMACLVLTVPHPVVRHYCYRFWQDKPFLLEQTNNNLGCHMALDYQHSAQEWLDEKSLDPTAKCRLPLTLPLLKRVTARDEISDYEHKQSLSYRGGVYDGDEREFRGFQMVEARDCELDESSTNPVVRLITRTWYHTGLDGDATDRTGYFNGDASAITLAPPRFTQWDNGADVDVSFGDLEHHVQAGVLYGLKGQVLRSEIFGEDQPGAPYTVTETRPMVRIVQPSDRYSAIVPFTLESLGYQYERIVADPQCNHEIGMAWDRYGMPLISAAAAYPRRAKPAANPYPETVLNDIWDNSYDAQQDVMRLSEDRQSYHHIDQLLDDGYWRLGLPQAARGNVLTWDDAGPLSYEMLAESYDDLPRQMTAQSAVYYDANNLEIAPDFAAMPHHNEAAIFDQDSLAAYADRFPNLAELEGFLVEQGYTKRQPLLTIGADQTGDVWVAQTNLNAFDSLENFHVLRATKPNLLYDGVTIEYDEHRLYPTSSTDPLGNTVTAEFDYHFMAPWRQTDLNDNVSEVLLDPLGRVVAGTVYGTEEDAPIGFETINTYVPATLSLDEAVADPGALVQGAAGANLYEPFSWMGRISQADVGDDTLWTQLIAKGYILPQGHICALGRTRLREDAEVPAAIKELIGQAVRMPPHAASFAATEYEGTDRTIKISIIYTDGFGRQLQSKGKVAPGEAYKTEDGALALDGDGKPIIETTQTRWATSARIEYNKKGEPYRQYRPFFTDTHHLVDTQSMRAFGHYDIASFDALGRVVKTVDAKGHVSRQAVYPWFTIAEDANDTGLIEAPPSAKQGSADHMGNP